MSIPTISSQDELAKVEPSVSVSASSLLAPATDLLSGEGETVTYRSYYYAIGQRVAIRVTNSTGSQVYFLLGDHLGSTTVVVDSAGNKVTETRYLPWGGDRSAGSSLDISAFTDYGFTRQHEFEDTGLYFYNSRWFDPYISRWTSPDTIIPDPYNPLDWDRYQYVRSNPVLHNDPTGHDVGCPGRDASECTKEDNLRRQDLLFSKMFKGSGKGGRWTLDDWNYYYDHRNDLWSGRTQWKNPDSVEGWDLFALHVERLSTNYDADQTEQFIREFALVFGGISATKPWPQAVWDSRHGPTLRFLNEGNQGLDAFYLDSLDGPTANQSHYEKTIRLGPRAHWNNSLSSLSDRVPDKTCFFR